MEIRLISPEQKVSLRNKMIITRNNVPFDVGNGSIIFDEKYTTIIDTLMDAREDKVKDFIIRTDRAIKRKLKSFRIRMIKQYGYKIERRRIIGGIGTCRIKSSEIIVKIDSDYNCAILKI